MISPRLCRFVLAGLACLFAIRGASGAGSGLPIEQVLDPEGRQVALPHMRPQVIALSPDGNLLVTSGYTNRLIALDPVSGAVRQSVGFSHPEAVSTGADSDVILLPEDKPEASYTGLSFSHDGQRIFLSDVKGSIQVFGVGPGGRLTPLHAFALPPSGIWHRRHDGQADIPAGLAISEDDRRLYVALNLSNQLVEMDAATGSVLRRFAVGVEPYDVLLRGNKAYVSNWGGRRPDAASAVGPAGLGTKVRVDPTTDVASEGSVSVIDLAQGRVTGEILTGRHASGLAGTPDGRMVAVANAGEDTVSVIDSRTDRIVETIGLRWHPGDLFGASPNALAFDRTGRTLFVCNGTQNAVAVVSFRPGKSRLEGLIPVGWFPGAIAYDARRKALDVANIKGEGREIPAPLPGSRPGAAPEGFNSHAFIGSVSLLPVPEAARLQELTKKVLKGYGFALMEASLQPARPGEPARPVPERVGEPSVFRHVIYIIKENRTYDQVLGDMPEGNGEPRFCIFGQRFTPNLHKIAREFVLLDNTCCAGVLSADGHQWATTGFATDYIEKSFAGFVRSYPFGGRADAFDAMAYAPTGFIWDDALAHGRTVRNYGEFMQTRIRWRDPRRAQSPTFSEIYRDIATHAGRIDIGCFGGLPSLAKVSKLDTAGWPPAVPDQYRVDRFLEEFHAFEKSGRLPGLIILYLCCDHTLGTKPEDPTPAASIADNDLAVGRVVEALSHSPYWKDTCLFAIEDDPQSGWDHVTGYRTTAFVASAYTRRHAVVSERYTQPGLLRTIELILGLPPMNQLDAAALSWAGCFTGRPDFSPYTAVPNLVPLDQLNPQPRTIKDRQLRKDARVSAKLPFDEPDKCPEDVLNRILWRAQRGTADPYPQWAVLTRRADDDD